MFWETIITNAVTVVVIMTVMFTRLEHRLTRIETDMNWLKDELKRHIELLEKQE